MSSKSYCWTAAHLGGRHCILPRDSHSTEGGGAAYSAATATASGGPAVKGHPYLLYYIFDALF